MERIYVAVNKLLAEDKEKLFKDMVDVFDGFVYHVNKKINRRVKNG